jgi:signal transduction histidine kinase
MSLARAGKEGITKAEPTPIEYPPDEVRILASISELIGSSMPLEEVIAAAMRAASAIVRAEGSSVLLIDREKDSLSFYIALGDKADQLKSITLAKGEGIAGFVAETGEPLIVSDVTRDPRFSKRADQTTGFTTRSIACVPLRFKDNLTGVIEVVSQRVGAFTPRNLGILTVIGGPIAIMLENARLMNEIKGMHDQLGEAVAERRRIAMHNTLLLEQANKQAMELERANRVKSEFLGIMSHELKTPLHVITGYAELMRDKMLAESDKGLAKIIQYSHDLSTLIDSILTATKVEAGGVSAVKDETNLNQLLGELKSLYDFPLSGDVAVVWNLPARLPRVITDGRKLIHVLQNLINNALKYTEKGTVTITARLVLDSGQEAAGRRQNAETGEEAAGIPQSAGRQVVEVNVADTGIGIPREKLSAIFEMFCQVDDSPKRARGGVGLGLYIVKNFAQMIGAEIRVESEPGKGSIFTVTIPV